MGEAQGAAGRRRAASDEIVAAVRALAPARREVIVLHYWLDLAVDEIAALLGLPFGTVASRLSRAWRTCASRSRANVSEDLERRLRDVPARVPSPDPAVTRRVRHRVLRPGAPHLRRRTPAGLLAAVLVGIAIGYWVVPHEEPAIGADPPAVSMEASRTSSACTSRSRSPMRS